MNSEQRVPNPSTRAGILDDAKRIITQDRSDSYGPPEDNFRQIAEVWNWYLRHRLNVPVELRPHDVALLMDLLKTARMFHNSDNYDTWLDKAGYVGCGWGCVISESKHPIDDPWD